MNLLPDFQPYSSLPTPQQIGIGEWATTETDATVVDVIDNLGHSIGRKRKCYTAFSDEDGAAIGKYATENSNNIQTVMRTL